MNVVSRLTRLAEASGDRPALIEPSGRRVTFAQLEERSATLAGGFRGLGLTPGDRVLLLMPMSITLYQVLLALFRARLPVVLLDPSAPKVEENLARIHLSAFVGSAKAHLLRFKHPALRGLKRYISDGFTPLPHRNLSRLSGPPVAPEDPEDPDFPALLTFTTGSTGRPKTVARSHAFLDAQRRILGAHMGLGTDDIDLPTLPVFLLNSLAAGATCVLPDADLRRVDSVEPERVVAQLRAHGCTATSGSPAFYAPIAKWLVERDERLTTLQKLFTGGARVPPELLGQLRQVFPQAHIEVVYGSTEAEPIATLPAESVLEETAEGERQGRGSCVGTPVPDIEVRICAPGDIAALPQGEIGEVLVAGEHVNRGYFEDPEADAANKVHEAGRVWHRTGDTGYLDNQGRIWLVGRVKDMVGSLHPFMVEGRVNALPWVTRAALVEDDGSAVLAVSAPHPPEGWRAQLGQFGVDTVLRLDRIPVDPRHNAKIDRAATRAAVAAHREASG